MEKLRDIKGVIDIPDYSLWIFTGIVCLILIFIWYLFKSLKLKKKSLSKEEIARRELRNLNLSDSKKSAYKLSRYAKYIDSEVDFTFLQKYKYRKNVSNFDEADKKKIEKFLQNV